MKSWQKPKQYRKYDKTFAYYRVGRHLRKPLNNKRIIFKNEDKSKELSCLTVMIKNFKH